MMKKIVLFGAVATGYVLGARAGRERYEKIRRTALRVKGNPTVQATARHAADAATAAAPVVKDKVAEGASMAAHGAAVAAQKVRPGGNDTQSDNVGDIELEESAYPKA